MTTKLHLESQITFTGKLIGKELFDFYNIAHIGVGSLGLHRKKLTIASSLKDREYCALGIPFISSGEDPDFPETFSGRYKASSTDEPLDIEKIIEWISDVNTLNHEDIRTHAENNCDFKQKINFLLNSNN